MDDEIRASINKATRSETKTSIKRKRSLKERSLKRKLKKSTLSKQAKEDDERGVNDVVPFGVQAMAPPEFTVVPKKVGGGAGALRVLQASLTKESHSFSEKPLKFSNEGIKEEWKKKKKRA